MALGRSYNCPNASEVSIKDIDKTNQCQTTTKHNKAWIIFTGIYYIDGLVQEIRNSSALAMELRLSCINPSMFCQISNKRHALVGNKIVDHSDAVGVSQTWRCSNYIFMLDLAPGFSGLGKDNCKMGWNTFKCWGSVHLYWRFDSILQQASPFLSTHFNRLYQSEAAKYNTNAYPPSN